MLAPSDHRNGAKSGENMGMAESNNGALTTALLEALPYINYFAGKTIVVKIGGSTLGSGDTTLQDIVWLKSLGVEPVIVHGGGSAITDWLGKIGKPAKFVRGLRVTDEETMEVVRMTLAGKVNTELVATLNGLGGRSVGITGLDGNLLQASRLDEDLGLVGKVVGVDLRLLQTLVSAGYIVVIAPIGSGQSSSQSGAPGETICEALNLNADTAAAEVAAALHAEKLILLSDVPGILDSHGQVISLATVEEARALIADGTVTKGMIPKVEACIRALDGVRRTHIIDGRVPHALIRELFTDQGVGTMITHAPPNDVQAPPSLKYLVNSVRPGPESRH
jgi:acetylglutamate kinase